MYLPGRNIVLLGKAGVYCAAAKLDRLVLGTLDHNPFPDATPAFREAMATALSLGLAHQLTIAAPYATLSKAEVIRRGMALSVPLELTLSCMSPADGADTAASAASAASGTTRLSRPAFQDPTAYADQRFVRAAER